MLVEGSILTRVAPEVLLLQSLEDGLNLGIIPTVDQMVDGQQSLGGIALLEGQLLLLHFFGKRGGARLHDSITRPIQIGSFTGAQGQSPSMTIIDSNSLQIFHSTVN